MKAVGSGATVLAGMIAGLGAFLFIRAIPEIRRSMRISNR
jgi:MFS superfamily sulfate permease-like transporter